MFLTEICRSNDYTSALKISLTTRSFTEMIFLQITLLSTPPTLPLQLHGRPTLCLVLSYREDNNTTIQDLKCDLSYLFTAVLCVVNEAIVVYRCSKVIN